ncbi:arsenite methyltransferase [bacterium]|nr:arsenite methyltransferase [bacterium]
MDSEKIRETVRERYGSIARANRNSNSNEFPSASGSCCGPNAITLETVSPTSCCGSNSDITQNVSCCGSTEITSEQMAVLIGYNEGDLKAIPEGANMNLGCGNPVALASLKKGETVVDLGCGGGFDCFLAAREVGEEGQVIGVDMTADMISKARDNAKKASVENVEFRLGEIEHLPIADNTADMIMSNCVINLSPDKQAVYDEAFRVLKPGGRLSISDVLAKIELPNAIKNDLNLVSACIGGAATIQNTKQMLNKAGFQNIKIEPNDKSQELIEQWSPSKESAASKYVVSAYIGAIKPV